MGRSQSSEHLLLLLAEQLSGNWAGNGTVQFSTIDTFSYRESLSFVLKEFGVTYGVTFRGALEVLFPLFWYGPGVCLLG